MSKDTAVKFKANGFRMAGAPAAREVVGALVIGADATEYARKGGKAYTRTLLDNGLAGEYSVAGECKISTYAVKVDADGNVHENLPRGLDADASYVITHSDDGQDWKVKTIARVA